MDEYPSAPEMNTPPGPDIRAARRDFSRVGWSFFAYIAVTMALQSLLMALAARFFPEIAAKGWFVWALSLAPMYFVAAPVCRICLGRMERLSPVKRGMSVKGFFICLLMSFGLMYSLNLLTNLLLMLFEGLAGTEVVNPLEEMVFGTELIYSALFAVLVAPVVEELFFRKFICDRLLKYGEWPAVLVSAAMFGLFHGNFSQMLYAFGLGLLFAYVYVKTGRLRYTVFLHMAINFAGSVVPALVLGLVDEAVLDGLSELPIGEMAAYLGDIAIFGAYLLAVFACAVWGIALLIRRRRGFTCAKGPVTLPKGKRFSVEFLNGGMIVFALVCLIMAAVNLFQTELLSALGL